MSDLAPFHQHIAPLDPTTLFAQSILGHQNSRWETEGNLVSNNDMIIARAIKQKTAIVVTNSSYNGSHSTSDFIIEGQDSQRQL